MNSLEKQNLLIQYIKEISLEIFDSLKEYNIKSLRNCLQLLIEEKMKVVPTHKVSSEKKNLLICSILYEVDEIADNYLEDLSDHEIEKLAENAVYVIKEELYVQYPIRRKL